MAAKLSLSIPTPCHENWNTMTPQQQGRFCGQCNKTVVDFSLMTDGQILEVLKKQTGETCGRFTTDQLQRPLIAPLKPKWYSTGMWKYIISAALLGKANEASSQIMGDTVVVSEKSFAPTNRPTMGKIIPKKPQAVLETQTTPINTTTQNKLLPEDKKQLCTTNSAMSSAIRIGQIRRVATPVEVNYVIIDKSGGVYKNVTGSITDGKFTVTHLNGESTYIDISDIINTEIQKPSTIVFTVNKKIHSKENYITYQIVDEKDALPVPNATVKISINGTTKILISDANGLVNLNPDKKTKDIAITVSSIGYQEQTINTTIKKQKNALPKQIIFLTQKVNKMEAVEIVGYHGVVGKLISYYTSGQIVKSNNVEKKDTVAQIIKKIFSPKSNTVVYPNPILAGNNLSINYQSNQEEFILIQLFATDGRWLKQEKMKVVKGENKLAFNIPNNMAAQQAILTILNSVGKKVNSQSIIITQ